MSERMPNHESAPKIDPYDFVEKFAEDGEWSSETEDQFSKLFESHEVDLYMIYLNYKESGLVDELPEHESSLYKWLDDKFKDIEE